jgi:excisionase family DNA binding protein
MDSALELLTVREAAAMLRLSLSKIYRLLSTGELPCYKVGTRKLISKLDIRKFLESCRNEPVKLPQGKRRHF